MKDCSITIEDKKSLLDEYRNERKRARKRKGAGSVSMLLGRGENNSLFSASFCSGSVEATVLADQGCDVNLLPKKVLKEMLAADFRLKVISLCKTLEFYNAHTGVKKIQCATEICADIMLCVRHGTSLMMHDMKRLIPEGEFENLYIGLHVLVALGLNNRVMLAAAAYP